MLGLGEEGKKERWTDGLRTTLQTRRIDWKRRKKENPNGLAKKDGLLFSRAWKEGSCYWIQK